MIRVKNLKKTNNEINYIVRNSQNEGERKNLVRVTLYLNLYMKMMHIIMF